MRSGKAMDAPVDLRDPLCFHVLTDYAGKFDKAAELYRRNAVLYAPADLEDHPERAWHARENVGAMEEVDRDAGDGQYVFFTPGHPYFIGRYRKALPSYPIFAFKLSTLVAHGTVCVRPHDLQTAYVEMRQALERAAASEEDAFGIDDLTAVQAVADAGTVCSKQAVKLVKHWYGAWIGKRKRDLAALENALPPGDREYEGIAINVEWDNLINPPSNYPEVLLAPEGGLPLQAAAWVWLGQGWIERRAQVLAGAGCTCGPAIRASR
jgi:hypothetical protein